MNSEDDFLVDDAFVDAGDFVSKGDDFFSDFVKVGVFDFLGVFEISVRSGGAVVVDESELKRPSSDNAL